MYNECSAQRETNGWTWGEGGGVKGSAQQSDVMKRKRKKKTLKLAAHRIHFSEVLKCVAKF